MRRSSRIAAALILATALITIVVGLLGSAPGVYTTEPIPDSVVAQTGKGAVCQPVALPTGAAFSQVTVLLTDTRPARNPFTVTVRAGDRVVGSGRVVGRRPQYPALTEIGLGRRVARRAITICFASRDRVGLYGSSQYRFQGPTLLTAGVGSGSRLSLSLQRPGRHRVTALADAVSRARLFRAGWLQTWMAALVAILATAGVTLLSAWVVLRAGREPS